MFDPEWWPSNGVKASCWLLSSHLSGLSGDAVMQWPVTDGNRSPVFDVQVSNLFQNILPKMSLSGH